MPQNLNLSLTYAALVTLSLFAPSAWADSSSALSASSASIGSVSTSFERSSQSSSGRDRVAEGRYTLIDVAQKPERADQVQLRLLALKDASAQEVVLWVPRALAARQQLTAGETIVATHRPYGISLAREDQAAIATPFFLVLEDAWYREIASRAVTL